MSRWRLICTDCGQEHAPGVVDYTCPECAATRRHGECLRGVLRVEYETPARFPSRGPTPREGDHRRYLSLLPLDDADLLPPLPVGPTALHAPSRLRAELGMPRLFLKDDTLLPTGSLKDRASSLIVAKARERGERTVVTASTGNAATALAAMCAAVDLDCVILVPADAPPAKLIQMLAHGAHVLPLKATYDEAFTLSLVASDALGWYNRSTAYNPYTIEGKKTVAFEIWEQLGGRVPDAVVLPVGDGAILAGVAKGFADLRRAGWTEQVPRLIAVQAAGSAAIVNAWERCRESPRRDAQVTPLAAAQTVADSIRVAAPANGRWALRELLASGGAGVAVSDDEILGAVVLLARLTGVFAEPAGAAALAGLPRALAQGYLHVGETVVLLVTGSGLKDLSAAGRAVRIPTALPATLDAVRAAAEGGTA